MKVDTRLHFIGRHGTDDFFYAYAYNKRIDIGDSCNIVCFDCMDAYVKNDGEKWVLHYVGEPALVGKGSYDRWVGFFENGVSLRIEDLSISDEEKCILALKYTYNTYTMDSFHRYHV